ncbi:MAG: hypothetical protein B6I24_00615 [Bacteroidetes bacterium 4572_128]|nr:MAG: hypothetical protein B6I24_00615 [Bacteroidetes bacterium 4572_128]
MKKIYSFVFFYFFVTNIFSQSSLNGIVKDEKGEILAGASVVLENTEYGIATDKNGNFNFENLKVGSYKIKISFIGYEEFSENIYINGIINKEFLLKNFAFVNEEIVISATRVGKNTPMTFKNIDKKDMENKNLGQDIPTLLKNTPSVVMTSDAGAGIGYSSMRVRGIDAERVNITLNGVPFNDAESYFVGWVNLPDLASSVENIQIQRGVGTSTNGGTAFGASVNLQTTTTKETSPYGKLSISQGSFNTQKYTVNGGTGLLENNFSFDVRASQIRSDGFIDRASSDLQSVFATGAYHLEKGFIRLNAIIGQEETYQAWNGVPKELLKTDRTYNKYTYNNQIDHYEQEHYQLLFAYELSKNLNINGTFNFTHGEGYYESYKFEKDFFDDYNMNYVINEEDTTKESDFVQRKYLDNNFYFGTVSANYKLEKLTAIAGASVGNYKGDHFGNVIKVIYPDNNKSSRSLPHQWYFNDGKKQDINTYLKLNYEIINNIYVFGDAQFRKVSHEMKGIDDDFADISQEHEYNFFNPKTGVFLKMNDNFSSYFSYAIAHREASRRDFKDSKDLEKILQPKEEKLEDFEFGVKYKNQIDDFIVNLGANFYYMNYTDQRVQTGKINNVGSAIMTNVDKSYRQGIEIDFASKYKKISWNWNATFSENKIENFTEYVDDWNNGGQISIDLGETDLAFSPNFIFSNDLSYQIKNFKCSILSKFVDEQFIDNTSNKNRKLDDYLVHDLKFNFKKKINDFQIDIFILVNNFFNEKYETNAWVYRYFYGGEENELNGYFPQAGRNYLIGITVKF